MTKRKDEPIIIDITPEPGSAPEGLLSSKLLAPHAWDTIVHEVTHHEEVNIPYDICCILVNLRR